MDGDDQATGVEGGLRIHVRWLKRVGDISGDTLVARHCKRVVWYRRQVGGRKRRWPADHWIPLQHRWQPGGLERIDLGTFGAD